AEPRPGRRRRPGRGGGHSRPPRPARRVRRGHVAHPPAAAAASRAIRPARGAGAGEAATRLEIPDSGARRDEPERRRGRWAARAGLGRLAAPSFVPVTNATGVVLHTNLGRAPLAAAARAAMQRIAAGYASLEYDVGRGSRGSRQRHCRDLLIELTGAEDALVVNNAAGALLLALSALARGGEAVVSRGELVEIGGSFRIPDILARSGARLVEVGATNRTHRADYDAALTPGTRLLLQ